jgi:hypothetical protein
MTVVAVATGAYGVALLAAPEPATGWWPWPVDAFHGRMYAAAFLTAAVGSWLAGRRAAPRSWLAMGVTLTGLGVAAVAGALVTGATRSPVFEEALSFLAAHLVLVAVGMVMLTWAAADQRRAVTSAAVP